MPLAPERRAALQAAKLMALVDAHRGEPSALAGGATPDPPPTRRTASATAFAGGAILRADDEWWILPEELGRRGLGPSLAWADAHHVARQDVHVVADGHAGHLARRATAFAQAPQIWHAQGLRLIEARPDPMPAVDAPTVPEQARTLAAQLELEGVDVVVEHGEVIGEVAGLEVARITLDPAGGPAQLEVGVGRHDRDAFAIMHGDQDPLVGLARVASTVRDQRRPGADPHPLNRLGAHRWLRSHLVANPQVVGAVHLAPVAGLEPRPGVKDTTPVAAVGQGDDGESVVVVASVGIDLDLVPEAADLRRAHAPGARLVLVVPERDTHLVTRRLAAGLIDPAEVVAAPNDWR